LSIGLTIPLRKALTRYSMVSIGCVAQCIHLLQQLCKLEPVTTNEIVSMNIHEYEYEYLPSASTSS